MLQNVGTHTPRTGSTPPRNGRRLAPLEAPPLAAACCQKGPCMSAIATAEARYAPPTEPTLPPKLPPRHRGNVQRSQRSARPADRAQGGSASVHIARCSRQRSTLGPRPPLLPPGPVGACAESLGPTTPRVWLGRAAAAARALNHDPRALAPRRRCAARQPTGARLPPGCQVGRRRAGGGVARAGVSGAAPRGHSKRPTHLSARPPAETNRPRVRAQARSH